jgi:hypothetical protein
MANADGELTVAQRLGRALDRGLLPAGGPAEAAERLIERLERPARVALLGLPGSGKSSILNLLVGAVVVPETLRLPTIVVQHGAASRMICTLTDASSKILPGHDLAAVLPLAPALVTLEMDLPALKVISLLEVSAGPMETEQKRAATWASKRADIVIWCTTSYLPKEQAVWESLPDGVKDNSFMFLTKVDLLGSRESAQAMHDRVELRAGEEFRQILSISAKQARAAMPPGGQVNRDLFRDSGAAAVISAIKTRVQSGRRADTDTAELLLARHVEATELVARRFAEPGEEPAVQAAWTPPPEPADTVTPPAPVEAEPEPVADPVLLADMEPVEDADAPIDVPQATLESVEEPGIPVAEAPAFETTEAPPAAVQVPEAAIEPKPEPEPEAGTRRRFADRIKRVASDGDVAATPLVPLRSTWKSKGEVEAPQPADPEPQARPPETARRPRTAPPAKDSPLLDTPPMPELAGEELVPEPLVEAPPPDEVAPEHVEQLVARGRRAITPRPAPEEDEAPRVGRPGMFSARRNEDAGRSQPLPDLSRLRATKEEMEAALEGDAEDAGFRDGLKDETKDGPKDGPKDGATNGANPSQSLDQAPTAETTDAAQSESAADGLPAEPAPVEPPVRTAERPRLFDRARATAVPAAPPVAAPDPGPRTTPLSRQPAPPRVPVAPAAAAVASASLAVDDGQFSPRAIMRRELRVDAEAPAPRRERTRIAARAVPAAAAPQTTVPVSGLEHELVDEAISLIVTRSAELEREVDPESKAPIDLILDHARDTADQIMAVISQGKSDDLRRISGDLGEVVDLIMLMQLEKGHAPADDALTLLLQLKRELETLRAV